MEQIYASSEVLPAKQILILLDNPYTEPEKKVVIRRLNIEKTIITIFHAFQDASLKVELQLNLLKVCVYKAHCRPI